jgi:flavin-binding protein dodecin
MTTQAKPEIHLNGTSPEVLEESYADASSALGDAIRTLEWAAPNARDYYVQPAGTLELAQQEHAARIEALRRVQNEIRELWAHVTDHPANPANKVKP